MRRAPFILPPLLHFLLGSKVCCRKGIQSRPLVPLLPACVCHNSAHHCWLVSLQYEQLRGVQGRAILGTRQTRWLKVKFENPIDSAQVPALAGGPGGLGHIAAQRQP